VLTIVFIIFIISFSDPQFMMDEHENTAACRAVDCKMAISEQRLGKHVPVSRQQILNYATVGLKQWKSCVFYVVRAERL
jgi:hypothetical protein